MKYAIFFLLFVTNTFGATVIVSMSFNRFSPPNVTINVGDTVRWNDVNGMHDTVSGSSGVPSGEWNSNTQFGRLMRAGESFSHTFNRSGTFPYYCTPHWEIGMVGTITVLGVNSAPNVSILTPADGANFPAPADITVEATASDPDNDAVRVEFFVNGVSLGSANAPPYRATANNLGPGNYRFDATATDTSNASRTASVSVTVSGAQPVIASPPQSQIAAAGSDVRFSVQALGSPPLAYEWFFETAPIAGANTASLLLTNVSSTNAGVYTVRVSNEFGTASASGTLVVSNIVFGTPPSITAQPQSQSVNVGQTGTFTAAAVGSSPLAWQWFFNGAPILGATNESLVASSAGEYFAVVSNPYGVAESSVATLTFCAYSLSSSNAAFMAAGGIRTVTITATSACVWTVVNTLPWIIVESTSDTVSITALANPSRSARSGIVTIAGINFPVTQSGVKGDFNHDSYTDFLWQHSDGRVLLWLMNGVNRIGTVGLPRSMPGARIVSTHDFNLDGHEDILWQRSSGALDVWFMNGLQLQRSELIHAGPGRLWQLVGLGDFNGDTHADFLFRHRDGYLLLWTMQGTHFLRQQMLQGGRAIPPIWRVAGVTDFDNDGDADIVWQHSNSSIVVWFMKGITPERGPRLSHLPLANARIIGVHDLNQDGSSDFLWRHPDGRLTIWWMNRTNRIGSFPINHGERVSPALTFAAPRN